MVDCFANAVNAKMPRFYSLFFQPGSLGADSVALSLIGARKIAGLCPSVFDPVRNNAPFLLSVLRRF